MQRLFIGQVNLAHNFPLDIIQMAAASGQSPQPYVISQDFCSAGSWIMIDTLPKFNIVPEQLPSQ